MPSLILRYEEETEKHIEDLQLLLDIKTKNKTIIEVLDNYENLQNQLMQQRFEVEKLTNQITNIKNILLTYQNAKTGFDDLIDFFKRDY